MAGTPEQRGAIREAPSTDGPIDVAVRTREPASRDDVGDGLRVGPSREAAPRTSVSVRWHVCRRGIDGELPGARWQTGPAALRPASTDPTRLASRTVDPQARAKLSDGRSADWLREARIFGFVGGEVAIAALPFDGLVTLHALKDELAARGVKVSHNAVWLFLRREGLRFKKNAVRS